MSRVLVIDDDKMIRLALCRALSKAGHETRDAGDGKRGVALAQEWAPDLVVTDISMPEQEGMQTISELRELAPRLPIIVMSGERGVGAYAPLTDARLLGADVAIAKPFDLSLLLTEVERLLKRGTSD
jgi:DNA-binding response OmpR family regulator